MKNIAAILLGGLVLLVSNVQAETGVSRTAFTSAIQNKEPVSNLQEISTDISRVYFFTELLGLNGHNILHRWEYNGQVLAEITFQVGGDRWRTWSSKNILASWTGKWQVSVLDEGGNIIEQSHFDYIAPVISTSTEASTETQTDSPETTPSADVKKEE